MSLGHRMLETDIELDMCAKLVELLLTSLCTAQGWLHIAKIWPVAGAKNKYLAYWSPLVATVALVTTGAELTGPSMNPAFVSISALMHRRRHPLCHSANSLVFHLVHI